LAATTQPAVLDDRDRQVLAALAVTAMGAMKLARRVEVCPMTIRRRVRSLIGHGLVFADPRKFFSITNEGRKALGDAVPPRWVRPEAVSAATAKDVSRREHPNDDRSNAQVGRPRGGRQALMRAMAV
jgi:hypothetical protein